MTEPTREPNEQCAHCKGTGAVNTAGGAEWGNEPCPVCKGTGIVPAAKASEAIKPEPYCVSLERVQKELEQKLESAERERDELATAFEDQKCPECGRHRPYCDCLTALRAESAERDAQKWYANCSEAQRERDELRAEVESLKRDLSNCQCGQQLAQQADTLAWCERLKELAYEYVGHVISDSELEETYQHYLTEFEAVLAAEPIVFPRPQRRGMDE